MSDVEVCVIGNRGNMGRRYCAILEYLGVAYDGFDLCDEFDLIGYSHYIVATPTDNHNYMINRICKYLRDPAKILVEKPITKVYGSVDDALEPCHRLEEAGHKVYMVNNYNYTVPKDDTTGGHTYYNFYNTGDDGLLYDCIQLLHLAKGSITLETDSPVWYCTINGTHLNREMIDLSYVLMIQDFIGSGYRLWGMKDIIAAHTKVKNHEDTNRSPSEIYIDKVEG